MNRLLILIATLGRLDGLTQETFVVRLVKAGVPPLDIKIISSNYFI